MSIVHQKGCIVTKQCLKMSTLKTYRNHLHYCYTTPSLIHGKPELAPDGRTVLWS